MDQIEELTDEQLEQYARQVDDQFSDLIVRTASLEATPLKGGSGEVGFPAAPKQQVVIEAESGEKIETFWQRYVRYAKKDICEPEGILYQQWHKWKDLSSKDAVKVSIGALAAMGVSTASLPILIVPVTVFLLNVLTNIGIEALCEDCAKKADEEKENEGEALAL